MAKKAEIEQTEIDAPYELPNGWKWVKIGDIAEIINGKNQKEVEDENGVYPIYGSGGIIGRAKDFICPENCTIIGRKGTINNPIFVKTKFWNVDTAFGMKTFDCVNPKFYFYFCRNFNFTTIDSSSAIPSLTKSNIQGIPFPLPPTLTEQQRIVKRIETMFAKLDQAQEKAQTVLDSFENRKAFILHKAFTGELTANWRKENGVSDDSWEEKTLGEMTKILSSKRIFKEEYVETGVPFYRSTEIVELNDFGTTNPQIFITKERYKEIKEKYGVPEVGDLLVTSVGTIGKTWIVDDRPFYYKDGNLTQVKKCALLNMQFLDKFIKSSYFINQVFDTVAGTAYNALTIAKFSKIIIPVPTLPEQQEIVRILDTVLEKESRAKEAAQIVLDQIALLKKSILARAFRGEL